MKMHEKSSRSEKEIKKEVQTLLRLEPLFFA